jgi:DNA processing protein
MQQKLVAPPDLREPDHPEVVARLRDSFAWEDCEAGVAREVAVGQSLGARCWLPEGSVLATVLGARAPRLLFCLGAPELAAPAVAIVGTRRPDGYGLDLARRLGRAVAAAGGVVVSGGAAGIDTAAHEGALEARGRTIVVLGNGLARPHPPANQPLFDRIVSAGSCVLSEYPPTSHGFKSHFPERNRLVAALADAVAVVQARAVSGALITAEWARRLGVPVYAVPGDAWYETSAGPIDLLRRGARPLASVADLEEVPALAGMARAARWPRPGLRTPGLPPPWRGAAAADSPPVTAPLASPVLDALVDGPLDVDGLVRRTGRSAGAVQAELLELEVAGLVARMPGGLVVRTDAPGHELT